MITQDDISNLQSMINSHEEMLRILDWITVDCKDDTVRNGFQFKFTAVVDNEELFSIDLTENCMIPTKVLADMIKKESYKRYDELRSIKVVQEPIEEPICKSMPDPLVEALEQGRNI